MNHWLETSKRNLLPLSIAIGFEDALSEWLFTGTVYAYENEDVQCQLCDHLDLVYHFEIKNRENSNLLLVGSSCILKFDNIEVSDKAGNQLHEYAARKKRLEEALKEKLREQLVKPLRLLWRHVCPDKDLAERIERLAKKLKNGESLPPMSLLFLFKEMERLGITYQASMYKISLRTPFEIFELEKISNGELQMLKRSLSAQQMLKYRHLFILGAPTKY